MVIWSNEWRQLPSREIYIQAKWAGTRIFKGIENVSKYQLDLYTTDAASEPCSAAEAKTFMRIDHSDEDTLITELITVARQMAEDYTNRSFITQTHKMYFDEFPTDCIRLPRGSAISVVGIDYAVSAAHDTEFSSANYNSSLEGDIGIIEPSDEWPDHDTDYPYGIEVEFTAGYGTNATDVPTPIKSAIYLIVSDLYEFRNTHSLNRVHQIGYTDKPTWQFMLDKYKIHY